MYTCISFQWMLIVHGCVEVACYSLIMKSQLFNRLLAASISWSRLVEGSVEVKQSNLIVNPRPESYIKAPACFLVNPSLAVCTAKDGMFCKNRHVHGQNRHYGMFLNIFPYPEAPCSYEYIASTSSAINRRGLPRYSSFSYMCAV